MLRPFFQKEKHRQTITSFVVGAEGFEPPASRSQTVRSTRLSHAPSTPLHFTLSADECQTHFATNLLNGTIRNEIMCPTDTWTMFMSIRQ
ncbi:MAG: hypothetical protein RI985_1027 [Chloroflexota bacterium]